MNWSIGDEKIVKVFIENGADVNASNADGDPMLVLAARKSNIKIVKQNNHSPLFTILCKLFSKFQTLRRQLKYLLKMVQM